MRKTNDRRAALWSRAVGLALIGLLVLAGSAALASQTPEGGDEEPILEPEAPEGEPAEPDQAEPGGDDVGDPPDTGSASLSATPATGPPPLTVVFNGSSTARVAGYTLTFGDGELVEGKGLPAGVSHTYVNEGTYSAVLTVTAANEDTFTSSATIEVAEDAPTPTETETDEDAGAGGGDDSVDPGAQGPDSPLEELEGEAASAELPNAGTDRSLTVASVRDPTELSFDPRLLGEAVLITALLILLIAFPAEMFNATLLEN
jgi:hypothetical protein